MIFADNRELDRQGKYTAPEKVTGAKRVMLAALGYKDTGESNGWGKVMNMTPGVSAIGRNALAGAISKGTDTNQVIKDQRGEAFQDSMNGLAFAFEGAKLAATMGTGGAAGSLGNGLVQKLGMGGMANAGGSAIQSTLSNMTQNAAQDQVKQQIATDVAGANTDNLGTADYSNYTSMPADQQTALDAQKLAEQQEKQNGFVNGVNKINNVMGKIPVVGGLINAGVNTLVSGVALNKAGSNAWSTLQKNATRQTNFNYL